MSKKVDLTGLKFGKLTVIKEVGKDKNNYILLLCICECGGQKIVNKDNLKGNRIKSCGCLQESHNHYKSRLYHIWSAMIQRCTNINNPAFKDYGGRGIKVCDRWLNSFSNFLADMGEPKSIFLTLDRYPNKNGNYEPGNCRWATFKEQTRNKRNNRVLTYGEEKLIAVDWAKILKISAGTLYRHLRKGHSIADIIAIRKINHGKIN